MMETLLDENWKQIKCISFNLKDFDTYSGYAWMIIDAISKALSPAELNALHGFFCMSQIMVKEAGFKEDKVFLFNQESKGEENEC